LKPTFKKRYIKGILIKYKLNSYLSKKLKFLEVPVHFLDYIGLLTTTITL
jgi:hypothetical protein